jgi:hypothetical protein
MMMMMMIDRGVESQRTVLTGCCQDSYPIGGAMTRLLAVRYPVCIVVSRS